jgi:hypothetical protein
MATRLRIGEACSAIISFHKLTRCIWLTRPLTRKIARRTANRIQTFSCPSYTQIPIEPLSLAFYNRLHGQFRFGLVTPFTMLLTVPLDPRSPQDASFTGYAKDEPAEGTR